MPLFECATIRTCKEHTKPVYKSSTNVDTLEAEVTPQIWKFDGHKVQTVTLQTDIWLFWSYHTV